MSQLFRRKPIADLLAAEGGEHSLKRVLGAGDLIMLAIGAVIGAGIFGAIGTAAAGQVGPDGEVIRYGAGPALVFSFLLLGGACALAALCYAELAAMIPQAGSAYAYSYATLGELVAWIIGWDLILEYSVGNVAIAISWGDYFTTLLRGVNIELPIWLTTGYRTALLSSTPALHSLIDTAPRVLGIPILLNLPAFAIVMFVTWLLLRGARESATANNVMVVIKLLVLALFIGAGFLSIDTANYTPFSPNGFTGIHQGAAIVFFAYIGFDAISTTAEEAKNPQRDLPIGIIASLIVCTVLYLVVSAVLTGIVPVVEYRENVEFLNAPVAYALAVIGQDWASYLVSAGAVAGITSVLLVMLMSQPRIFFAMSRDGLLPRGVSKVHPTFGTPYITTIITCVVVAIVAGLTQIQVVGEMTSIGTLFAFVVVCAAVIVLRIKRPDARRSFRVPGGIVFPICGILSCAYLMLSLPVITWVRFLVWLDIGLIIYWVYGRARSPLVDAGEARRRTAGQHVANFVTAFGVLGIFNGVCVTILGFMTELGISTEITAKWHEIGVTADQADTFGLQVLGVAVVVYLIGRILTWTTGER